MSQSVDVRPPSASPLSGVAQGFLGWICTNNPFYVLSAALFLVGLFVSFGAGAGDVEALALMSGLGGYTLLLAATALLLVRYCKLWDDTRTVLLLIVLMFLAMSVTFDEMLVVKPSWGIPSYLGGLAFSVVVSELLFRGIRLRLPAGYRLPYYLILAVFYLYPLALRPWVYEPRGEILQWGLFGFATVAGLAFLTLLPAIRRGPGYVRDNGSPWTWPLYPGSLFVFLAIAVIGRAFLLCWSMHLLGAEEMGQLIFGPYFLVPFGLVLTVLLLECGLVVRSNAALTVALAGPVALVALARFGHRPDPIYHEFLARFTTRLGADPLFVTLLIAVGFYCYTVVRRVAFATEALTCALVALAVVGPDSLGLSELGPLQPLPLLAAATLQLVLAFRYRQSWRCLLGGIALVPVATLFADDLLDPALRAPALYHLVMLGALAIGAMFDDRFARSLRGFGATLAMFAGLVVALVPLRLPPTIPPWSLIVYPVFVAFYLALYGWLLSHRLSRAAAVTVLTGWVGAFGWRGYLWLRTSLAGFDYLVVSLVLFVVAVLISLGKAGVFGRWGTSMRGTVPRGTE